jgi:hypothetical protein
MFWISLFRAFIGQSKPEEVRWLCGRHHSQRHPELGCGTAGREASLEFGHFEKAMPGKFHDFSPF